jgi:hypothetical protein
MASASTSDLIDYFKLETQFCLEFTLEIAQTLQLDEGRQMVEAEKKWTKEKDIGCGAFGDVQLKKNQIGDTRAVKIVRKGNNGVDLNQWYGPIVTT